MPAEMIKSDYLKKLKSGFDFILNHFFFIFFVCLVILYSSREIIDLDLWLHLKTGQYILQQHIIPASDIFSFTMFGKPWINHEWLFQVIIYLFHNVLGANGIMLFQNITALFTFIPLFLIARKKNHYLFVFSILYLAVLACAYRFMSRPDACTLVFIVFYLCVLKLFSEKKSSFFLWLLPVFQVIWANIHGFSFLGVLIVFIFLFGELVKRFVKLPFSWNQVARLDNQQLKQLLIVLGLLILASFINPYGYKGAFYPFSVLSQIAGKGKVIFQYVRELLPPFNAKNILDLQYFPFFKILILFSLASFYLNYKKLNIVNFLFWLFFLVFALKAQRNVVYFPPLAAFVIFNNLDFITEKHEIIEKLIAKVSRYGLNYFLAAALFFAAIFAAGQFTRLIIGARGGLSFEPTLNGDVQARYPKKGVDFLLAHNFPERMFNDFNSGALLVGCAFPQRKVFIDGRTELYGADFLINYIKIGSGQKEAIEGTIQKFGIQGFFLTISANDLQDGLIDYLISQGSWKIVYLDESAIIFLKDIPENNALIKEFQIDLKEWAAPKVDTSDQISFRHYPYANFYRARFFHRHGFYKAAADEAKAILKLRANDPEAKNFVQDYYISSGDSANALAEGIKPEIYFNRGIDFDRAGKFDAAIKNLEMAGKMSPKNDMIFFALGNAWKNKGDLNNAIKNFSYAVEINPRNLGALHNRAVAYCLTKNYAKSWVDVHRLRSFGVDINPKVLIYLQSSSGRIE